MYSLVPNKSQKLYWLQFSSATAAAGVEDKQRFNFGHAAMRPKFGENGHGGGEILSKCSIIVMFVLLYIPLYINMYVSFYLHLIK